MDKPNLKQSEEELFCQWEANRRGFVPDGAASEMDYLLSNPKIVFILKEANDPDNNKLDIRNIMLKGERPQTWNNIARWVHGINNLAAVPAWNFYEKITNDFRAKMLKSISTINLKKSPGIHAADHASLSKVANEDKEYIRRQYSLYDPDFTICGGTGELFRRIVNHDKQWNATKRGIQWYERKAKKYVISFVHPEARVQDSLLIYGLLDAIREILNK